MLPPLRQRRGIAPRPFDSYQAQFQFTVAPSVGVVTIAPLASSGSYDRSYIFSSARLGSMAEKVTLLVAALLYELSKPGSAVTRTRGM